MTNMILASKSQSRKQVLEAAGLNVEAIPSHVNEDEIKKTANVSFDQIAQLLAFEKARTISAKYPGRIIIGGDQLLICDGKQFDKAKNLNEAKEHLKFFRGKPHTLITSIVLVENEKEIWSYIAKPTLYMRNFSDQFLQNYLEKASDALLHSVGCYFIEDMGIQLFSKIDGDYHAILGMPLLPLLNKLRDLKKI